MFIGFISGSLDSCSVLLGFYINHLLVSKGDITTHRNRFHGCVIGALSKPPSGR